MGRCIHEFKKDSQGEVTCIFCGDKDDEMEADTPQEPAPQVDFWATQTSFE